MINKYSSRSRVDGGLEIEAGCHSERNIMFFKKLLAFEKWLHFQRADHIVKTPDRITPKKSRIYLKQTSPQLHFINIIKRK